MAERNKHYQWVDKETKLLVPQPVGESAKQWGLGYLGSLAGSFLAPGNSSVGERVGGAFQYGTAINFGSETGLRLQ
jgi:hypothetical protein